MVKKDKEEGEKEREAKGPNAKEEIMEEIEPKRGRTETETCLFAITHRGHRRTPGGVL